MASAETSRKPRLSEFGPAFAWLLRREVSSARLASLFGTTPANVRVIAFRARHGQPHVEADTSALGISPPRLVGLGIRTTPDEVVLTPARVQKLEWLRNEIDETVRLHAVNYEFLEGVRALRRLLPQIGYAGDAQRIGLRALLHQHIAWFLVHSGRSLSAAQQARKALDLWRIAYHESENRVYGHGFIQASLIGSNALLLVRQQQGALEMLDVARDAAKSIRTGIGSEYYRQRGVALFQLAQDEPAAVEFERSTQAMEQLDEERSPVQLLMTGSRHTNLLGRIKADDAHQLFAIARHVFGELSLEASMALHWAAACGLSTDSPSMIRESVELLNVHSTSIPEFGHQGTIRRLLAVTPELGFDNRLTRIWVRRALYENAFRDR